MAGRWPGLENDWRGRPKEPPTSRGNPMADDVTSGEKAPLGRILYNFRLRMRTPFHPLRVTFGHYGWRFIMSLPVKKPHYTTYLWYKHLLIDIIFIKLIQLYPLIPDYLVTRKRHISVRRGISNCRIAGLILKSN